MSSRAGQAWEFRGNGSWDDGYICVVLGEADRDQLFGDMWRVLVLDSWGACADLWIPGGLYQEIEAELARPREEYEHCGFWRLS